VELPRAQAALCKRGVANSIAHFSVTQKNRLILNAEIVPVASHLLESGYALTMAHDAVLTTVDTLFFVRLHP
jgi:hypothetical protein